MVDADVERKHFKEYDRAVAALQRFLQVDPTTVRTFSELQAAAASPDISEVGRDLYEVVPAVVGQATDEPVEYIDQSGATQEGVVSSWLLTGEVAGHQIKVSVNADQIDFRAFFVEGEREETIYDVNLLVEPMKAVADEAANRLNFGAADYGIPADKVRAYYPAQERDNPVVQQGYLRLLQRATSEILQVASRK